MHIYVCCVCQCVWVCCSRVLSNFSRVWHFMTLRTVAFQVPLSTGLSQPEHWSGLSFPTPRNLPDPGIKPSSPTLQADSLLSEPPGSRKVYNIFVFISSNFPHFLYMYLLRMAIETLGLPRWPSKEYNCQYKRLGFDLWVWKIPWSRKWQPTPVFLSGKFHGQRNLTGYSLRGHKESDTTEGPSTHTEILAAFHR